MVKSSPPAPSVSDSRKTSPDVEVMTPSVVRAPVAPITRSASLVMLPLAAIVVALMLAPSNA